MQYKFIYSYYVHGFDSRDKKDKEKVYNLSEVIVYAKSEKEAIRKAKALLKRKFYRVARIVENRDDSGYKADLLAAIKQAHENGK